MSSLSIKKIWSESTDIFLSAFSLVVAFAWRDAFNKSFDIYIKNKLKNNKNSWLANNPDVLRFIYAIILTLIIILSTFLIKKTL